MKKEYLCKSKRRIMEINLKQNNKKRVKSIITRILLLTFFTFGIYSYMTLSNISHETNQAKMVSAIDSTDVSNKYEYMPDVQFINSIITGAKKLYDITVNF